MEGLVGSVTHYFPKIGVCVAHLSDGGLTVGDRIRIKGTDCDYEQTVMSMQIDHKEYPVASPGATIGLKTELPVRSGAKIYKINA